MRCNGTCTKLIAIVALLVTGSTYGQQGSSSNGSSNQGSDSQRYDNQSHNSQRSDSQRYNDSAIQARSDGRNYYDYEDNKSQSSNANQSSRREAGGNQSSSARNNRSFGSSQSNDKSTRGNPSQSSGDSSDNYSRGLSSDTSARDFIQEYDRNGDSVLSRNELPSGMRSNFDSIDRNDNGYLSASELRQHASQMASSGGPAEVMYIWITGANRGQPTLQDLQQAYDMLQKIDQDNDGYITRSELRQQQSKVASQWINHCFARLDENNDDEISRSEAENSRLGQQFDELDTNRDGYLTRSELRQDMQRGSNRDSTVSQTPNSERRR